MLKFFALLILLCTLVGCSKSNIHELKSPCVATDPTDGSSIGSPCSRRLPTMNDLA